jgi:hypothetical protein
VKECTLVTGLGQTLGMTSGAPSGRNQIDPFGDGHRIPGHRGATLTGNRDYGDSWIYCDMDPSLAREIKYERLFFLDEATALAGGFRPCNRCRHKALETFKQFWNVGVDPDHRTHEIDIRLREEGTVRKAERPGELPAGVIIRFEDDYHLIVPGGMRKWSFDGYGPLAELPKRRVEVTTPPSTVEAMRAGYVAERHPSADA